MHKFTIKISEFISHDQGILKIADAEKIPREVQDSCCCCGVGLMTAARLQSPTSFIRLGSCPKCGYVGYIDRPTRYWVKNFYNVTWDEKGRSANLEEIKEFKKSKFIEMVRDLGIDVRESIFEVGTGYGQILKQFKDAGYNNLFGIEHAPHRAKLASEYARAKVLHGEFGSEEVLSRLKLLSPFKVIFSKSVLEHMYDPRMLFAAAGELQKEGDYLLLGVPNAFKEPTPLTLFFIPHLHVFTAEALQRLAYSYGYQSETVFYHGSGIYFVARKFSGCSPPENPGEVKKIWEKWIQNLKLETLRPDHPYIFWWSVKDTLLSCAVPLFKRGFLNKICLPAIRLFFRAKTLLPIRKLFFGIPRRSGSFIYKRIDAQDPEANLLITMDQLKLYYK